MKILHTTIPLDLNENSLGLAVNMMLMDEEVGRSVSDAYFVVCMAWPLRLLVRSLTQADMGQGGSRPLVFYVPRKDGWDSPYAWDAVMMDPTIHQPIAKVEMRPTS